MVSNQRNGIDVDKLDYFLRDSTSALGESSPLIHVQRLIDATAVFPDPKSGETTVRGHTHAQDHAQDHAQSLRGRPRQPQEASIVVTLVLASSVSEARPVATLGFACSPSIHHTLSRQVCYEEKLAMDLLHLFKVRMQLHAILYQHHVCNVVEEMITDALTAAKGVPMVRGEHPAGHSGGGDSSTDKRQAYDLVQACDDPSA